MADRGESGGRPGAPDPDDEWWSSTQELLLEPDAPSGRPELAPEDSDDAGPPTEWFTFDEAPEESPALPRRRHHVTAVLVAHDGGVWLPAVLTTLAQQTRPADAVVGVDTGSTDDSAQQMRRAFGEDRVLSTSATAGFGQAVRAGLAHAGAVQFAPTPAGQDEPVAWIWLLHDDCSPDPTCLEALLSTADDYPDAAVLGPKILGWHDRRLLLEAGVSITGAGGRYTGLERGEHDQGQHDGVRDVMSVSSAGMLVQRDLWDRLQGFDPNLPLFRDDLDFCWRAHRAGERVLVAPDAVAHHREASAHGRRAEDIAPRPHRADREAAVHVLLAHTQALLWPLVALRLLIGSALRSLLYLIGKDFKSARDEVMAVISVAAHPASLRASRTLVQRTSTVPAATVRPLRPTTWSQARHALEALGGVITTSGSTVSSSVSALESGPTEEGADFLEGSGPGLLRRLLVRPGVLLFAALAVFALAATRGLWWGDGVLQGGALLPSPPGAGDLWDLYTQTWHDVGPGSTTPAPPYLMPIFALAALLLGKAPAAVGVVLLLSVPIAGWSMYFVLRGAVSSAMVRVWAGASYALLAGVTGAVSSGRIGTSIVAIALPYTVRSAVRISRTKGTFRRAAGTALLLSLLVSVAPALWFVALVAALAAGAFLWRVQGSGALPIIRRYAIAVLAPIVLLFPWSWYVITNPSLLLLEPGVQSAALGDPGLNPFDVLLLHPGGPGMTPLWACAGILVAGLAALLRPETLPRVAGCLIVGSLGLALGVVQTVLLVTPPSSTTAIRPWPGPATVLLGMALIAAAAFAADGLRERFAGASFSIGQPIAAVIALLALLSPIASAATWLPGAPGVMVKAPISTVPAFVEAEAATPEAPRTLVLLPDRAGSVSYSLINGAGPTLGDADVGPPRSAWEALDPIVAALASGRGGDEVRAIGGYGVRYLMLGRGPAEQSAEVVAVLDGEPGLRRLSSDRGDVLWRVGGVTTRARSLGEKVAPIGVEVTGNTEAPSTVSTSPYIDADVPTGTLVLGTLADPGWRAWQVQGEQRTPLTVEQPPDLLSWSQGFAVPSGGTVEVSYDQSRRTLLLWLQLAVLIALIVMALPARRQEDPDPDLDARFDTLDVAPAAVLEQAAADEGIESVEADADQDDPAPPASSPDPEPEDRDEPATEFSSGVRIIRGDEV